MRDHQRLNAAGEKLRICPRCKERCLDPRSYGESALYRSRHQLCVPCFHDEDAQIEREGTNNLPDLLKAYGPENDCNDYVD